MTAYVFGQRDSYSIKIPGTPAPDPAAPPPPGMFEQFSVANWRSTAGTHLWVHVVGDNIDQWYYMTTVAAGEFRFYPAYEDVGPGPQWSVRTLEVFDDGAGISQVWNADPGWHASRLLVGLTYNRLGRPALVLLADDREDAPGAQPLVGVEPIS